MANCKSTEAGSAVSPLKGDQRREGREDGEERIERTACGHHRQVVTRNFGPHSLGDLPPALERDAVSTRGVAAVRIGLAAHGLMKDRRKV